MSTRTKETERIVKLYDTYVMKTYGRVPLCLHEGHGARVTDIDGKKYLDFFPGWAVSGIGHCHPRVVAAVAKQAKKLMHVSNNFYSENQALLAKAIIERSFPGKVFFCNSGAEANEGAVKLARKYGHDTGRFEVITMLKSFHGRTLAMIAATGQEKVKKGFEPLPPGFVHVPFNDLNAVKSAINERTIAIMLEPIQCEGGINIAAEEYMARLRAICDEKDLLLILDEVQTGMGRTGKMFCYQHYGIEPDVMTLAKTLGGGVPIGATVARMKVADILTPGTHASTFGGNPLAAAAALAVFEAIDAEKLLSNARKMGALLGRKIAALKKRYPVIKEIRGMALTIGVEFSIQADAIASECADKGLLINCTQGNVLRIMPPLTVTAKEIDEAIAIIEAILRKNTAGGAS